MLLGALKDVLEELGEVLEEVRDNLDLLASEDVIPDCL